MLRYLRLSFNPVRDLCQPSLRPDTADVQHQGLLVQHPVRSRYSQQHLTRPAGGAPLETTSKMLLLFASLGLFASSDTVYVCTDLEFASYLSIKKTQHK